MSKPVVQLLKQSKSGLEITCLITFQLLNTVIHKGETKTLNST